MNFSILKGYSTNPKYTNMHDLGAIYTKVKSILAKECHEYFPFGGNVQFYPRQPLMTDLELISLVISGECTQIDSENLLWSKLKTDYPDLITHLPHRTKFNKRRKRLAEWISACTFTCSKNILLTDGDEILIVDSMPIPTCKISRESSSTICRDQARNTVIADKGKNVAMGGWYIGYKFHLITTASGIYKEMMVTSASTHDNYFLKALSKDDTHLKGYELLGDRAYIGKNIQLNLFEELELIVSVPYRRNQHDYEKYDYDKKIKRKNIEVVFSQYTDEFNIKRNYAKSFDGVYSRIVTKVAAKTIKQFINFINGKPINQTKHAFAA